MVSLKGYLRVNDGCGGSWSKNKVGKHFNSIFPTLTLKSAHPDSCLILSLRIQTFFEALWRPSFDSCVTKCK